MPPRKAAKAYQGPPLFLSLAPEIRARIYRYYFPGAIVRFTRPTNGSKARVYYKPKIALMLVCRMVYLESHPIYSAFLRVVLRNVGIPRLPNEYSPFKSIESVELVDSMKQSFSVADLPALRTLKISVPAAARGFLLTPFPQTSNWLERFIDGSLDDGLKEKAKSATLTFRSLPLPYHYPPNYDPTNIPSFRANFVYPVKGSNWLSSIILDSKRKLQVIDTLTVHFDLSEHFMSGLAELRLQYDVDTLETVERVVFYPWQQSMEVWEGDGVINKYNLRKDKTRGKLVDTRMATAKQGVN